MSKDIIDFLTHDRSFCAGKELYSKQPNKNKSFEKQFNRKSDSEQNKQVLFYQLWKLTGNTERQLQAILAQPIVPKKETPVISLGTNDSLNKTLGTPEPPTPPTGNTEAEEKAKALETFTQAPDKVKQSIKIREQFPFLNGKDCPDVYKVLVADLITAYSEYKEAHKTLFQKTTQEERFEVAKAVVDPYKENKLIFEELEHYQAHGKPLGKHSVFEKLAEETALQDMSVLDLTKKLSNAVSNRNRNKKKLKKVTDPEDVKKFTELVAKYNAEIDTIKKVIESKE